jgi:hypothetical protein
MSGEKLPNGLRPQSDEDRRLLHETHQSGGPLLSRAEAYGKTPRQIAAAIQRNLATDLENIRQSWFDGEDSYHGQRLKEAADFLRKAGEEDVHPGRSKAENLTPLHGEEDGTDTRASQRGEE